MCGQIPALQEASIEREGRVHKVNLLQMDNGIFAFCYEGTMKIGTLAVSTPGLTEGVVGTSSVLLGGKYLIAARALAERSAAIFFFFRAEDGIRDHCVTGVQTCALPI